MLDALINRNHTPKVCQVEADRYVGASVVPRIVNDALFDGWEDHSFFLVQTVLYIACLHCKVHTNMPLSTTISSLLPRCDSNVICFDSIDECS